MILASARGRAVVLVALFAMCSRQLNGEGLVTNAPIVIRANVPLYPALAASARVSGVVLVRVEVRDGAVTNVGVLKGPPLLVDDTITNIKTWQFEKGTDETFESTFTYDLATDESDRPSNPVVELRLPNAVRVTLRPTRRPVTSDPPARLGKRPR